MQRTPPIPAAVEAMAEFMSQHSGSETQVELQAPGYHEACAGSRLHIHWKLIGAAPQATGQARPLQLESSVTP